MGSYLQDHMIKVEKKLLAESDIASNTGHPLHKGTPRETFLRTFLQNHLSEVVSVGQGEIFGAASQSKEKRNQMDIIIYRRHFPRLHFDGTIAAFMAESVVATIEVKSKLTKEELGIAMSSAQAVKQIPRHIVGDPISWGYRSPGILSYVVAYDGPASMQTVAEWLGPLHEDLGIRDSEALDGIFVLGKGFAIPNTSSLTFEGLKEYLESKPEMRWIYSNLEQGSLLFLFVLLTVAVSGSGVYLNPLPYMPNFGPIQVGHVGWRLRDEGTEIEGERP